jgi:hypothetical protein
MRKDGFVVKIVCAYGAVQRVDEEEEGDFTSSTTSWRKTGINPRKSANGANIYLVPWLSGMTGLKSFFKSGRSDERQPAACDQ